MIWRRLLLCIYILIIVGGCVSASLFFLQARREYDLLREREVALTKRLEESNARLASQQKILHRLKTDPQFVERVIRKRLGYAKPDELVFRFED